MSNFFEMECELLNHVVTIGLALTLLRLAWIDLQTRRLPDLYTLPLIVVGLGLVTMLGEVSLMASFFGGVIGFGVFWAVGQFYFTRHGREGLGLGDAKLFAASGTWLGYASLPYVLLIASLGGLVFVLIMRGAPARGIAFGPWLALGFLTVWLEAHSAMFSRL